MDLEERILAAIDSSRLRLIVMPTEQCNFRCTYCYEDFTIGHMPADVEQGLESLLRARIPELSTLELDWFGGEPLLALPSVTRVSTMAKEECERHDVQFISSATTNGWLLTPEHFERLVSSGVNRFQVSLDGYGEVHDATRRRRNGSGSFDRIWANLRAAHRSAHRFAVTLRIHMSPTNAESLPRLVGAVSDEFGADPRFTVLFKAIGHYHGPSDDQFEILTKEEEARLRRVLTDALPETMRGRVVAPSLGYVCYASEPNALVVRADGRLAKCTVALQDRRNDVGRLLTDGTLEVDQPKIQTWFRGIESGDLRELACPYSSMGTEPIPVSIGAR